MKSWRTARLRSFKENMKEVKRQEENAPNVTAKEFGKME
jgi:hypothetical protein